MVKIHSKMLLVIVIGLAVIASGCTGGQDITSVVKTLPEVQQFMKEHPNAQITVTYWSKEEVTQSAQGISQQCDKSITPVAMYKATVSEGDLKIVSWINAENQIVICSTTTGSGIPSKITPTPTYTATVPLTPTPTPTTTKEAAATIGENLVVEAVDGLSNGTNYLTGLNVTIRVASGGSDVDLTKLILKVKTQNYNWTSGTGTAGSTFRVFVLRDPDGAMGAINGYATATTPTLKAGALARLDADVSTTNSGLSGLTSKQSMPFSLTTEKGTTFNLPITLPSVGTSTTVAIYP